MILLMMGPQGSGKGTQAKRLAKEFNLFYFDVGAHLRKLAKADPRLGDIVNKRGELVPDEQIYKIVTDFLEEKDIYDNLVLDGYPRSVEQFELVSKWFTQKGVAITKAIFLRISEDVSIKRLSARRLDPVSGKIYNLITKLPEEGVDATKLVQREDDKPEAIRERLKHYHETTEPLVNLLRDKGMLIELNGELSIEEIYISLKEKVKEIK